MVLPRNMLYTLHGSVDGKTPTKTNLAYVKTSKS